MVKCAVCHSETSNEAIFNYVICDDCVDDVECGFNGVVESLRGEYEEKIDAVIEDFTSCLLGIGYVVDDCMHFRFDGDRNIMRDVCQYYAGLSEEDQLVFDKHLFAVPPKIADNDCIFSIAK